MTADSAFAARDPRAAPTKAAAGPGGHLDHRRDESTRTSELHRLGFAHSFEAWEGDALAGGLYGVSLGGAFFGESMFADRPDASKVAFVRAVEWLAGRGVGLVDCQVRTEHLVRFGAREVPRAEFLARLARARAADAPRQVADRGAPSAS